MHLFKDLYLQNCSRYPLYIIVTIKDGQEVIYKVSKTLFSLTLPEPQRSIKVSFQGAAAAKSAELYIGQQASCY